MSKPNETPVRPQALNISNRTSAGPVAWAFETSDHHFPVLSGPIGSGKTTAGLRRALRLAATAPPSHIDGLRRARVLIATPSQREMVDCIEPVVMRWLGDCVGSRQRSDFGVDIHVQASGVLLELNCRWFGRGPIDDFFRGRELSGAWFPHLHAHDDDAAVTRAMMRIGRWPAPSIGPVSPLASVWGDIPDNAEPGWLSTMIAAGRAKLFLQPAGYDPLAEDGFAADAENVTALKAIDPRFYRTLARRLG